MKVLLLCAGYGTRFLKDVESSEEFHHLKGIPKPLLPIAGKPLISHWMELLGGVGFEGEICLVVNELYAEQYIQWRDGLKSAGFAITLVKDGSNSNETRLGAVACIQLALEKALGFQEDVLVIAGDTLFDRNFDLKTLFTFFRTVNQDKEIPSSVIVDTSCAEDEVCKRGIIETDPKGRVLTFLEKPQPCETRSRKQCPCFYLLHSAHLTLVASFLGEMQDQPLEARDATGNFLRYLVERSSVYSMSVPKRYDVGSLQTYLQCSNELQNEPK